MTLFAKFYGSKFENKNEIFLRIICKSNSYQRAKNFKQISNRRNDTENVINSSSDSGAEKNQARQRYLTYN